MTSKDDLTESQLATLSSLADLTDGGDEPAMIGVLNSVDWDLQRAASLIFDHGASIAGSSSEPARPSGDTSSTSQRGTTPAIEQFEIDDSEQANTRPVAETSLSTVVTYPFALLTSLLRFLLRLLPWRFIPFSFSRLWTPSAPKSSQTVDDWVRNLEEELGIGSASDDHAQTSSLQPSTTTSGLIQRPRTNHGPRRVLPDLERRLSYETFLRKCVAEAKIGCIILISEENDDAESFKRNTLSDPVFVDTLRSHQILTWAGPTHLLEPYKASLKLSSTTYPFVAFVALQPRRHSSRARSSEGTLTILSRHEGPEETTTDKLQPHIENVIIPRVTLHLLTVRQQREEAASRQYMQNENYTAERRLRAEQDAAYQIAADKDRERIENKRREIDSARRRAQQEETDSFLEAERIRTEVADRTGWRVWEEHHFGEASVLATSSGVPSQKPMRLVLRMSGVEGKVWMLSPSTSLTSLYARIDSLLKLPSSSSDTPPLIPSFVASVAEAEHVLEDKLLSSASGTSWFPFTVHLAYPRTLVPWTPRTKLADVDELRKGGGGVIIVELSGGSARSSVDSRRSLDGNAAPPGQDSDGYESEE